MAVQKIKFKVTLKELAIEFEGSQELGQAIHTGVTNTLGSLMKTQQSVMSALPGKPEPTLFDAVEQPEPPEAPPAPPAPDKPKRVTRKSNGQPSIPACILALKGEGFFSVPRSAKAIQEHLKTKKGYNINPSSMSGPLQKLTRDGELYRETIDEVLHYQDKPFDENQRNQGAAPETPE